MNEQITEQIIEHYLTDAIASFRNYKKMAEKALMQVSDDEFFRALDAEDNSIAVIVKHIAGNQISRWTDFLISDGEKDFRDRDTEFELIDETRKSLTEFWETGWQTLFSAIENLKTEDFARFITIRGESHTITEAINRQLTHYAYHVGQITFLAKHFRSGGWKTLSVPRNKSAEFNKFVADKKAAGEEKTHYLDAPQEFGEKH